MGQTQTLWLRSSHTVEWPRLMLSLCLGQRGREVREVTCPWVLTVRRAPFDRGPLRGVRQACGADERPKAGAPVRG